MCGKVYISCTPLGGAWKSPTMCQGFVQPPQARGSFPFLWADKLQDWLREVGGYSFFNGKDEKVYGEAGNDKKRWSGREDLNLRHLTPHASALPGCATPR